MLWLGVGPFVRQYNPTLRGNNYQSSINHCCNIVIPELQFHQTKDLRWNSNGSK